MSVHEDPNEYGNIWDRYVKEAFPKIQTATPFAQKQLAPWRVLNTEDEHYTWPGDEWGDQETAAQLLDASLTTALQGKVQFLCELGAGAGRYTMIALERFPAATILSFDVSAAFEQALRQRAQSAVDAGRLRTYLLDEKPHFLLNTLQKEDLLGRIDGLFSFDAMVHVDLHTLLVYWLTATKILRPGGILAMSVADACSEKGFMKLLHDAPGVYHLKGKAGGHFMWITQDIVESTLSRLGFEVTYMPGNGRDLFFSATLADPDRANAWLKKAGVSWHGF